MMQAGDISGRKVSSACFKFIEETARSSAEKRIGEEMMEVLEDRGYEQSRRELQM